MAEALNTAFEKLFDPPTVDYSYYKYFPIVIRWLYNTRTSFNLKIRLIAQLSNSEKNSAIFKEFFLFYQSLNQGVFHLGIPVDVKNPYIPKRLSVVFNTSNLLKIARILLPVYNKDFWNRLDPRQKQAFLTQLVYNTQSDGTYEQINNLFSVIDVSR